MNDIFWVSNYILQTCNKVLKFQQTVVTFALTVKTVSKRAKATEKNCSKLDVLLIYIALQSGLFIDMIDRQTDRHG